jgi:mannose-6-phosphate isomerase-like protein (cupin superfamily)
MNVINLSEKLSSIHSHYDPHIVAELNGQLVKLVKFRGPFTWHFHAHEDELFYVVRGKFIMKLRDGDRVVNQGEMIVIPRGVEHCPVAEEEVEVMLFEPNTTLNTGNVENAFTKKNLKSI